MSIRELEVLRDDCLVAVIRALRTARAGDGFGAGETLAAYERVLADRAQLAGE